MAINFAIKGQVDHKAHTNRDAFVQVLVKEELDKREKEVKHTEPAGQQVEETK